MINRSKSAVSVSGTGTFTYGNKLKKGTEANIGAEEMKYEKGETRNVRRNMRLMENNPFAGLRILQLSKKRMDPRVGGDAGGEEKKASAPLLS